MRASVEFNRRSHKFYGERGRVQGYKAMKKQNLIGAIAPERE